MYLIPAASRASNLRVGHAIARHFEDTHQPGVGRRRGLPEFAGPRSEIADHEKSPFAAAGRTNARTVDQIWDLIGLGAYIGRNLTGEWDDIRLSRSG